MNDRIEAALMEAKGDLKTATGKVTGNEQKKAEGHGNRVAGKVQNAAGKAEDAAGSILKR